MISEGADSLARVAPAAGLGAQALDEIRRAIVEGRLPAGSLTSVRALSDALGISRTPVREALADLANAGLVTFERNRGVRINANHGHDIEEIFTLRLMLEIPAMRWAAPRLGSDGISRLRRILAAMYAHLDNETIFMRHDRAFHRAPLEVLGNSRLTTFVDSLRDQTRVREISTVGRSRGLEAIVAEHRAILDELERGDSESAATAMERHLINTRELLRAQIEASSQAQASGREQA